MDKEPFTGSDKASQGTGPGARFCVLVADDEEPLRNIMCHILKRLGHEVTTVADGLEAWIQFRQTPFPVVVTDIRMPGLSGIELLKRIRKENPETEVVLVSGFGDTDVLIEALRHGASNFIEKPFTEAEFRRYVEPVLRRRTFELRAELMRLEFVKLKQNEDRANRMLALGRLVSGLAHEIHNPLTFIKGSAELLEGFCRDLRKRAPQGKGPDPEEIEEMRGLLGDLRHGIERIESMVEAVRVLGGRPLPATRNVRLAQIMERAFREASSQKPDEVRAEISPPPDSFVVDVCPEEVEGCFVNLLRNAFDATAPEGGVVRFHTREIPYDTQNFFGFVEVVVADDGPGIPRGIFDEVFTPFFTTKDRGMGLGLSIAYELAKRSGAQMEIETEEGKGTEVTVRMPFRLVEQA